MTTYTVTNLNDSGTGSLRAALGQINTGGGDTIVFSPGLSGGTITLTSGALVVPGSVTIEGDIDGNGTPDITVSGNHASGVFVVPDIFAVTFDGLNIVNGQAGKGAAILSEEGTVVVTNSMLSHNSASGNGGAIEDETGTVRLTNVTLSANHASGDGGGIYDNLGNVTLTNVTLSGNTATGRGGALFADDDRVTVTGATLSGNTAGNDGGGIANADGATATLTNVTLSGNTATDGGGVKVLGGTVSLINATLSGDTATGNGGGVSVDAGAGIQLTNSILAGNHAGASGADIDDHGSLGRGDGNIYNGDYFLGLGPTITNIASSDIFASVDSNGAGVLANNGGDLQTIALKASASNPAIDAGGDSDAPTADARGFARVDVPGAAHDGANISDLGAYEAFSETPSLVVTTLSDVVDPGDGQTSLREAINYANSHPGADTITFAPGLSGGTITLAGGALSVRSDVTIEGDIDGNGTPDITIDAHHASGVFDSNSASLTLDGFIIENGSASSGAGISAGDSSIKVTNSTLSGNAATGSGGAILDGLGLVVLTNVTLSNNSAGANGGAVEVGAGGLRATDVTVSGNTAAEGAGFYLNQSDATLAGVILSNNTATDFGGGIYLDGTSGLRLDDSTLSGNSAAHGGGLYVATSITTPSVELSDDTFSGNTASQEGGGIRNDGTMTLTNVTLADNTAGTNGGGLADFGRATLHNVTASGNGANGDGGGVYDDDENGVAIIDNSILAGNHAGTNDDFAGEGGVGLGFNIIGDAYQNGFTALQTGISTSDIFAAVAGNGAGVLANNGGDVKTVALNSSTLNPAIDAGNDALAPATDSRFFERADVPGAAHNGSNISDLGAYEVSSGAPSLVVTTLADTVDPNDGQTSLREAINYANAHPGADTITFAPGLTGGMITLALGTLTLNDDVTIKGDIDGSGTPDITVDGAGQSTVFQVNNVAAAFDGLNIENGFASRGGGIANLGGNVTLTNATLSGNTVDDAGGGIYNNNGHVTLINVTVSGNSADDGGGIYDTGTLALTNVTLSGNTASSDGGGIYGLNDTVTLTNIAASGNSASFGGALALEFATVTMTNSILAGNLGQVRSDTAFVNDTLVLAGGDIIAQDVYSGGAAVESGVATDKIFAVTDSHGSGVLANNGGGMETIALKDSPDNPALDASDSTAPTHDERGDGRVDFTHIPNTAGSAADLGAYELSNHAPTDITLSHAAVDEDSAAGTVVGALGAVDPDSGNGDTASFSLLDNAGGAFAISGANLVVNDSILLDYEQHSTEQVTVQATDAGGLTVDKAFTITINDINPEVIGGPGTDDTIDGGPLSDVINGGGGNDHVVGGGGDDWLGGGTGDDVVHGGDGNDTIWGEDGNDALYGDAGNDSILGGAGNDWIDTGDGNNIANGGDGNDTIVGGSGNDLLGGGAGDDTILGGDGNDTIWGEDGNDTINAGAGNDVVIGGAGADTLGGGAGDDQLLGGDGNDTLFGEDGNDFLIGGAGDDILTGGAGHDAFVFSPGDGHDTITDFTTTPGANSDYVWLAGTDLHTYADVVAHESFNSATGATTITYNGTNTITINNTTPAQLTQDHFIFS